MSSGFPLVPMAIGMMAGPQIISAIFLATSKQPVRNSLAFIAGATMSVAGGLVAYFLLSGVIGGGGSFAGTDLSIIEAAFVVLLVLMCIKASHGRHTVETPKWMESLLGASTRNAFRLGLVLLLLMPSDIVINLSAGRYLEDNNLSLVDGLPFVGLTILIAALPLCAYLALGERAKRALPGIREWVTTNSWMINVGVYVLFIYLLTAG